MDSLDKLVVLASKACHDVKPLELDREHRRRTVHLRAYRVQSDGGVYQEAI